MKQKFLLTTRKLYALAIIASGLLFFGSCAQDGYDDDERFDAGVNNTKVSVVDAKGIIVKESTDGKSQTFTWPVVMGAGGYRVRLIDVGNPDHPIINDSIVDGCTITSKREEDVNYELTILALGNSKKGNSDADTVASKKFTTFTRTYMTIPALTDGQPTDLCEWFAKPENAIPDDSIGKNLNYDLEGGATYIVSDELDFDAHWVTLRSNNKTNPANINYTTEKSCINFAAPFSAKYLHFDCSGMAANVGVFGFSKAPTAERDDATGFVIFGGNTAILSCTFDNVNGYFFWDSRKDQKIAAVQFLIDNCVVALTPPGFSKVGVIWTNKGGHINDLTISNSTFYNLTEAGDIYYFYQAGMYRAKDINMGSDKGGPGNSVSYKNCTFYRIGYLNNEGEWGNYNGMNGKPDSYWTMTNCIFYACSAKGGVPRRFLHGKTYAVGSANVTFGYNTYMQANGTFDSVGSYDTSGTQIEEDPQFANPAAGDFHISGAKQVAFGTGDPRWLP